MVTKDTTSTNVSAFDQSFLYPKKSNVKFLMGGVYFNGQSTLSGDTIYSFTTVANTRVPTSAFYLQTLAA